MRFSNNIISSWIDIEGMNSLMLHSIEKCNLNCYGCFNKCMSKDNPFSEQDILETVKKNGSIYDAIILSGGEFLVSDMDEIVSFIKDLRQVFDGFVTINSNGCFPQKIDNLFNSNLIDGVHLDVKIPYERILDEQIICSRWGEVLGFELNNDLKKKLHYTATQIYNSVQSLCLYNKGYSSFRTVRYPILKQRDIESIRHSLALTNKRYNSSVKWSLNDFVEL